MTHIKYKIIMKIFLVVVFLLMILPKFSYANTYSNNGIEIEVMPERRSYDYGDKVALDIKIKNKNRYGKLHYKILEVYSGGGFNIINPNLNEKVVDSFGSSEERVELKDKYYKEGKRESKGHRAYGLTEKEYKEFIKYRSEKEVVEGEVENSSREEKVEEEVNIVKTIANGIGLIFIILLLLIVIVVIFIWFIVKIRKGNGYHLVFIVGMSLLLSIIGNKTYGRDIYDENIKYEKTIQTQVNYANFTCTFDVKVEYYFVNTIEPITDLELDTDDDLLPDYLEVLYLTDLNNNDTDGDGLFDGVEVYRTYTDPLRVDTDNNGIEDSEEDYDNDGLSNIEEKNYGTDYENADTDFDKISDYDEINGVESKDGKTYQTDPLSEDTDSDGLSDYVEIKLGLNPTKVKSYGDIIDSEKKIYQEMDKSKLKREINEMSIPVNFYGEVCGDIDENVRVKISNNSIFDNTESVVGTPIIVDTVYGYNDGLKITFDLTKYKNIANRIQFTKIVNGKMTFVENTYVKDNILYCDCESGEYCLIDSKKFLQDLNLFLE